MKAVISKIIDRTSASTDLHRGHGLTKLATLLTIAIGALITAPCSEGATIGNPFVAGGVGSLYSMREAMKLDVRQLTDMSTLFGPAPFAGGSAPQAPPTLTVLTLIGQGVPSVTRATITVNGKAVNNAALVKFVQEINQGCALGFSSRDQFAYVPNGLGTTAPLALFPVVGGYATKGNQTAFLATRTMSFGTRGSAKTTMAGMLAGYGPQLTAKIATVISVIVDKQRTDLQYEFVVPVKLAL